MFPVQYEETPTGCFKHGEARWVGFSFSMGKARMGLRSVDGIAVDRVGHG